MLCTVSPGAARPSCAAVIRCQVRPSRDVQITAVCVAFAGPGARARGQVAASGLRDHPYRVAGQLRADPVGGREGPGQAGRAGPDGLRADRYPAARTAGQQRGRVPERGCAAAGSPDRGEVPAGPAVRRDQELLADHAVAALRAGRHDRAAGGDDAADDLEDPALLLPGIGVEGDRAHRQPRRGGVRGLVLARSWAGRTWARGRSAAPGPARPRPPPRWQAPRSSWGGGRAGGGRPPGAWRPATEHQGVAGRRLLQRVRVVPVVPVVRVSGVGRGHQAGRAFPDGRPVVAPAVLPGRAVVFVDAGVGDTPARRVGPAPARASPRGHESPAIAVRAPVALAPAGALAPGSAAALAAGLSAAADRICWPWACRGGTGGRTGEAWRR